MKKIFYLLLLVCSVGYGQTITIGGKVYTRVDGRFAYGNIGSSQMTGAYMFVPIDTATGAPKGSVAVLRDSVWYVRGTTKWVQAAGGTGSGGSSTDTTNLSNRVSTINNTKVDSVYRLTDSTFRIKINGRTTDITMKGGKAQIITDTSLTVHSGATDTLALAYPVKYINDSTFSIAGHLMRVIGSGGGGGSPSFYYDTGGSFNGDASNAANPMRLKLVGTAGTYGSATTVPVTTTDSLGRVTAVTPTSIALPLSALTQSSATTNQVPQWNGSAWVAATISSGGTPANPTAKTGTTAVNGSASTYMRSDAAPPIDTATIDLRYHKLNVDSITTLIKSVGAPLPIGTMYDSSNWVNTSAFEVNGTSPTISSGKIVIPGTNTSTDYIRLPNPTMLDNYSVSWSYKVAAPSGSDQGLQMAMQSINSVSHSQASIYVWVSMAVGGGGDFGKLIIVNVQNGSTGTYYKSTAMSSINAGDSISTTFTRIAGSYYAVAKNWRTGETVTTQAIRNFQYSSPTGITNNTAKIAFIPQYTASYTLCSIKYTSANEFKPKIFIAGNSLTEGSYSGNPNLRFAALCGFAIGGGSGDETSSLYARIREMIYVVQAKNVYTEAGTNDLGFGGTVPAAMANLRKIRDSLNAHGIGFYILTVFPKNSASVTTLNDSIRAQFPGHYVDTYTALVGSGTSLNASYDAGDGLHLNAAGHLAVANYIKADTIYQRIMAGVGASVLTTGFEAYQQNPTYTDNDSLALITVGDVNKKIAAIPSSGGGGSGITGLTAGRVPVAASGTTIANGLIRDDGTNIGIATAPFFQLDLGATYGSVPIFRLGNFYHQSYNQSNNWIFENAKFNGSNYVYMANGFAAGIHMADDNIIFKTAGTGSLGGTITWHNRLSVLTNGVSLNELPVASGTPNILVRYPGTDSLIGQMPYPSGSSLPLTTTGDIIYSSSGSTPARLGIGTAGQTLHVVSGVPAWRDTAAVNSYTFTNGLTNSSGTVSLGGTLPNSQTNLIGSGTSTILSIGSGVGGSQIEKVLLRGRLGVQIQTGWADGAYGVFTSAATITMTADNNGNILFNPSSAAAFTVNLPPTAGIVDGYQVRLTAGGTITSGSVVSSLTVTPNSGQTIIQASTPTTMVAGDNIEYKFQASGQFWFRIK